MTKIARILAAVGLTALLVPTAAQARDATRQPVPPGQTPPYVIPNPYMPAPQAAPSTGNRAADAYATGFAIGLGSVLLNKQREDEVKRQHEQQQGAPRR